MCTPVFSSRNNTLSVEYFHTYRQSQMEHDMIFFCLRCTVKPPSTTTKALYGSVKNKTLYMSMCISPIYLSYNNVWNTICNFKWSFCSKRKGKWDFIHSILLYSHSCVWLKNCIKNNTKVCIKNYMCESSPTGNAMVFLACALESSCLPTHCDLGSYRSNQPTTWLVGARVCAGVMAHT